jgi:lipopolysaccharide cholinephosphotransferase
MYKLFSINVHLNDFKKIFVKRTKGKDKIVKRRILGINFSYVNAKEYTRFVQILKFVQPYLKEDVTELINRYTRISKLWKISSSQYRKDIDIMQKLLDCVNPTEITPATGELREIQLKELLFTKELINEIEQNTGLKPFMDDGTLLGAVRHGGFIPWDDDVDFSLMREDYNKLREYMKQNHIIIDTSDWTSKTYNEKLKVCFEKYPNQIFCVRRPTSFKCYKGTVENFACVDFFALDYYKDEHNATTIQAYAEDIKQRLRGLKLYGERLKIYDEEVNNMTETTKNSNTISVGIDNFDFHYYTIKGIRRKSDIFPLVKMKFEDTEFYAPNNADEYLKTIYNFYKKIPINVEINKHKVI